MPVTSFSRTGTCSKKTKKRRFESALIDGSSVTIKRKHPRLGQDAEIVDQLENIRGIAVQYDTDKSEDVLEFTNDQNELTSLRLESRVDGVS